MYKKIILIGFLFFGLTFLTNQEVVSSAEQKVSPRIGVWITVFSPEKVIYSKENVNKLIGVCTKTNIDDIYLQIYRADKAYYDSKITDTTPYKNILTESKEDLIEYLIEEAHKNNIKVHAWLNLLSIAQNDQANIIKKYGKSVITKDQHGRTSLKKGQADNLDKYYIRENQLFLEAGDPRVREYLTSIVKEALLRYPKLDGVHLDYIRYPTAVPYIPGSRFTSHGLSYGYETVNLERFKAKTGLDVKKMPYKRENFSLWDKWRRDQVTELVKSVREVAKEVLPEGEVSATIVPSVERTYFNTLQSWTQWLKEDLVDYVVTMNYTDDNDLLMMRAGSVRLPGVEDRVQTGVGAYLLKSDINVLKKQIKLLKNTNPAGIVFFSYDEVAKEKELQDFMEDEFTKSPPQEEQIKEAQ